MNWRLACVRSGLSTRVFPRTGAFRPSGMSGARNTVKARPTVTSAGPGCTAGTHPETTLQAGPGFSPGALCLSLRTRSLTAPPGRNRRVYWHAAIEALECPGPVFRSADLTQRSGHSSAIGLNRKLIAIPVISLNLVASVLSMPLCPAMYGGLQGVSRGVETGNVRNFMDLGLQYRDTTISKTKTISNTKRGGSRQRSTQTIRFRQREL